MEFEGNGPVVCVYCASSPGSTPVHLQAARDLAHEFHKNSISLVYGGGTTGVMGELARTLVSLSGPKAVHGVIPAPLVELEAGPGTKKGNTATSAIDSAIFGQTTVVPDMHKRKKLMADTALRGGPGSGFVALSGGFGTLEEIMEMVTWSQLGIHNAPVVLYNVKGYWDGLLKWVSDAVAAGFVREGNRNILVEATTAEEVMSKLKNYRIPESRYNLHWDNV